MNLNELKQIEWIDRVESKLKIEFDSVLLPMRPSAVSGWQNLDIAYKTLCFLNIQGFPAGPAGVPEPVEF